METYMNRPVRIDMTEFDEHQLPDSSMENGIILIRNNIQYGIWTNVPHLCIDHSPTGYEWGYEGSGPADLALNIVENILWDIGHRGPRMTCYAGSCFEAATYIHQNFKIAFLVLIKNDTVIDYHEAEGYVTNALNEILGVAT
jgi:hypothetical protein